MRQALASLSLALLAASGVAGCATDDAVTADADNPFAQDLPDDGKEDSAYQNPDGQEVEVDLEGDVTATSSQIDDGPVAIAQFATTFFRRSETMFIESLAEEVSQPDRIEWQIGTTWYKTSAVPAGSMKKHWRLKAMNTVLLFDNAKAKLGDVFTAKVPMNPFTVLTDAGSKCADDDDHIGLDSSVYWYRWEPKASCTIPQQDLKITVSKKFANTQATRYPEYDQLTADKKVTTVVLFGEIDDGPITASETGMRNFKRFGANLVAGGYHKVTGPVGERYEKQLGTILSQIDLYSPNEFSGLDDYTHFNNFQKALGEHEIVAYDGHSMLGASDFWARPTYPTNYQIFLYGGCLGYEYYVKPILHGKGDSWNKLDVMSSVVEVSADANQFAAPAIAKLLYAIDHGGKSSWRSVLMAVRTSVGDSTFGVSGVRDNCYTPSGNRCH
ncbi:hypothetical protein BH11MYX2_BH11MYX2_03640 [soil metagenome]